MTLKHWRASEAEELSAADLASRGLDGRTIVSLPSASKTSRYARGPADEFRSPNQGSQTHRTSKALSPLASGGEFLDSSHQRPRSRVGISFTDLRRLRLIGARPQGLNREDLAEAMGETRSQTVRSSGPLVKLGWLSRSRVRRVHPHRQRTPPHRSGRRHRREGGCSLVHRLRAQSVRGDRERATEPLPFIEVTSPVEG